ncbi:MAG: hypothetical protein ACRESZ_15505 [Methylococcales bacterium]
MVDILPEISGVHFDGAWQRRFEATIDVKTGLKAHYLFGNWLDILVAR